MQWTSTIREEASLGAALGHAVRDVIDALGTAPDLALVFVSEQHASDYAQVPALLGSRLGDCVVVGCSASGVIGGGRELERRPAVSVTAAVLPDVKLAARYLAADFLPAPDAPAQHWEHYAGVAANVEPCFVVLADPFSFPTASLLAGLDRHFPRSVKLGGLASGAHAPGEAALFLDRAAYRTGALCLALSGDIAVETLIAQGCRPVGEPLFVTQADGQRLIALDGHPPFEVLRALVQRLDARDRQLMQHSLFLGIAMREAGSEYRQGDFLIRNLVGLDPDSGSLWVGDEMHTRQVVQFHLRDAETSAYDLERMLDSLDAHSAANRGSGALLFSCTGRGEHLYGERDHDSNAFRRHAGEIPLGGFFCNGEIGPVHGTTFLHGYTSAFGVFRPRAPR